MPRKTDKRERLTQAAKKLIHQQGFNLTTLADIAQEAGVPLGNVYYYFQTKEAIGEAVIECRELVLSEQFESWEKLNQPLDRLMSYVHLQLDQIDVFSRFGCPIGGLCQELAKEGGALADAATRLLYRIIEWAQIQFQAMGQPEDRAKQCAVDFLCRIQGMALLTNAFKGSQYASMIAQQMGEWIKHLNLVDEASEAMA